MTDCNQRLNRQFEERVRSLLDDGFLYIFISFIPNGRYIKLRHKRSGKVVSVRADFNTNKLQQYTDGKLVHDETVH